MPDETTIRFPAPETTHCFAYRSLASIHSIGKTVDQAAWWVYNLIQQHHIQSVLPGLEVIIFLNIRMGAYTADISPVWRQWKPARFIQLFNKYILCPTADATADITKAQNGKCAHWWGHGTWWFTSAENYCGKYQLSTRQPFVTPGNFGGWLNSSKMGCNAGILFPLWWA